MLFDIRVVRIVVAAIQDRLDADILPDLVLNQWILPGERGEDEDDELLEIAPGEERW